MYNDAGDLKINYQTNSYSVVKKRAFDKYGSIQPCDKEKCFDFAYDMTYGGKGEHRDSRSGGTEHRTLGQIFINTFQGKMAEFALYRYLIERSINVGEPDTTCMELGKWDSFDLMSDEKKISIKSTKFYGNLLLLETKDWSSDGKYIHNDDGTRYDYIVLVRFKPDSEEWMGDYLNLEDDKIPANIKDILIEKIQKSDWEYDFPGFIHHEELVNTIINNRIIPSGAKLNGKIKMDADNYYFQAGNMHLIQELYVYNQGEGGQEKTLKRWCPICEWPLRIKSGTNGAFWGCSSFQVQGCTYTDNRFE